MGNIKTNRGGVNREYGSSIPQKCTFVLLHLGIVAFCAWLICFDGWSVKTSIFDLNWTFIDQDRALILFACVVLYWVRHTVTVFYLLARKIEWAEVFGLLSFMALFEIGLLLLGGGAFRDYTIGLGWLDGVALSLLASGSYLNSFSEIQRKWWKKDSQNKDQCYTAGLFSYAMHINYFGDFILFTGWCLFTYNYWSLLLPLSMAYSFIYFHIPSLDLHLAERYGNEFKSYSIATKRFIPFVY